MAGGEGAPSVALAASSASSFASTSSRPAAQLCSRSLISVSLIIESMPALKAVENRRTFPAHWPMKRITFGSSFGPSSNNARTATSRNSSPPMSNMLPLSSCSVSHSVASPAAPREARQLRTFPAQKQGDRLHQSRPMATPKRRAMPAPVTGVPRANSWPFRNTMSVPNESTPNRRHTERGVCSPSLMTMTPRKAGASLSHSISGACARQGGHQDANVSTITGRPLAWAASNTAGSKAKGATAPVATGVAQTRRVANALMNATSACNASLRCVGARWSGLVLFDGGREAVTAIQQFLGGCKIFGFLSTKSRPPTLRQI